MCAKPSRSNSASNSRSDPSKDLQMMKANEEGPTDKEILAAIDCFKQILVDDRNFYIKKTLEENKQKLLRVTISKERMNAAINNGEDAADLLMRGQHDAINLQNGVESSSTGRSSGGSADDGIASSAILMGTNVPVKSSVRPIKLPEVKRLPPYTTWIFLDRNQRMAEDQSVVGRRRIYYDQNGGEALICSDSEEEMIEEEKKDFAESEDFILRKTIQQVGLSDKVLDLLGQCLSRKPSEVKARYEVLSDEEKVVGLENEDTQENSQKTNLYLDKDLDAALDSFDNLFCRRCYVFDCRLHGCSQDLVFPREKQHQWNPPDDGKLPCGPFCYCVVKHSESDAKTRTQGCDSFDENAHHSDGGPIQMLPRKKSTGSARRQRAKGCQSESAPSNPRNLSKKQDIVESGCESVSTELNSRPITTANDQHVRTNDRPLKKEEFVDESSGKQEINDDKSWKPLEKSLFAKGLEIFGRNSCLIARNLLNGLRTCLEVHHYMNGDNLNCNGCDAAGKIDGNGAMGNEVRRSRLVRRRGRVRRLKYTWKSAAYNTIRKRISEKKDQPCRQYNPCGCESACGKQCPCISNGTCCEKYCGCPKNCKFRFRGCHCAKSQCRSRQCPCFAADRECDPDVCRNCWVSCGDGTLGVPRQRGDNYECRNMKLLLKQQQRVLLGRSDVSGWGAFLKNSIPKHEYLGEYTGELISHREADKRGKIYDRENSSFLFNLNDQFVLDAYRKGDKLKFANHSPDPNCYAKVIMVAGDHRVGIFAKDRINAGEELFYDYRYEPDRAPAWARKPEAPGAKKDEAGPSSGRPKKLA